VLKVSVGVRYTVGDDDDDDDPAYNAALLGLLKCLARRQNGADSLQLRVPA
jgi:hypothetical protein